jgi:hypothetical protein
MTYTPPAVEVLPIQNPTKGRLAFTKDVQNTFEAYREDVVSFDASIAISEDAGPFIEEFVKGHTAAELFEAYRNLTGNSTDDIDHASAVVFSAAHTIWEALSLDYQTYLDELYED